MWIFIFEEEQKKTWQINGRRRREVRHHWSLKVWKILVQISNKKIEHEKKKRNWQNNQKEKSDRNSEQGVVIFKCIQQRESVTEVVQRANSGRMLQNGLKTVKSQQAGKQIQI